MAKYLIKIGIRDIAEERDFLGLGFVRKKKRKFADIKTYKINALTKFSAKRKAIQKYNSEVFFAPLSQKTILLTKKIK